MQRPSASVARELFITFSIKFDISTRISYNVEVDEVYSAECNKDENSILNFISPSFGLLGLGLIIFSVLCVITLVFPIITVHYPFSTPKRI